MVQKHSARLSWEDLEAVLVVDQYGSVRQAAESIGIAHTTLAKRVSNAEAILGIVAFVRGNKGYVATDAGRIVISHAERMAREVNALTRRVSAVDEEIAGKVRISMVPFVARNILSQHLRLLTAAYPNLQLIFQTALEIVDLEQQFSDVVIRFQDEPDEHLFGRRVGAIYDAVYASPELAGVTKFNEDNVAMIAWSEAPAVLERAKLHGFKDVRVPYVAQDMDTQVRLALAGEGIAILPCYVGDPEVGLERIGNVKPKKISDIWVLTHPDYKNSARVQSVARFCVDCLRRESGLLRGVLA
jgi:DNA-binding transcriptional LysR family regulator